MDPSAPRGQRLWTRAGVVELSANVAVIALVPIVLRLLSSVLLGPARAFGLSSLFFALTGKAGPSDIGWEIASSHGLISPDFSAYDPLTKLDSLIGMGWLVDDSAIHPPTALPLGLVLTFLDYHLWVSFWMVASACAMALSMRVMRVPAWVAYPVALGICLAPPGYMVTASTYPVLALVLAIGWVYRHRPVVAGTAYGLFAASRGVGIILLAYPLVRRRWRTVVVALGVLAALGLIAVAFEPTVIGDFLTKGRAAIEAHFPRSDLLTFDALLWRHGIPRPLLWIAVGVVAAIAWRLGRHPFWTSLWVALAVTPIAWTHSTVIALPFAVVMWQSGIRGRFLALLMGVTYVGINGSNVAWPIVVMLCGIALLACPLGLHEHELERT